MTADTQRIVYQESEAKSKRPGERECARPASVIPSEARDRYRKGKGLCYCLITQTLISGFTSA